MTKLRRFEVDVTFKVHQNASIPSNHVLDPKTLHKVLLFYTFSDRVRKLENQKFRFRTDSQMTCIDYSRPLSRSETRSRGTVRVFRDLPPAPHAPLPRGLLAVSYSYHTVM